MCIRIMHAQAITQGFSLKLFLSYNFNFNLKILLVYIGLMIGTFFVGFLLRPLHLSDSWQLLLSYPGELFTRSLQCCILPLVISSLVVGKERHTIVYLI